MQSHFNQVIDHPIKCNNLFPNLFFFFLRINLFPNSMGIFGYACPGTRLRVRLDGGVEKWEDGKVGRWKIFSFLSCVFGWRGGKVEGWKTLLFSWREKWKDEKCNLYKLTIIPLLHNM